MDKKLLASIVRDNLNKNNITKVEAALPLLIDVGIPRTLHYKALMAVADSYYNTNGYHIAFKYYHTARKFTRNIHLPLQKLTECLNNFFWDNELVFSTSDLNEVLKVIEPLATLLRVHSKPESSELKNVYSTIKRIKYRIDYTAPNVPETKVTFRSLQIRDAFYTDMTFEEMQTELARLVALMILTDAPSEEPEVSEEKKEKSDKPAKKTKKPKADDNKE